MTSTQPRQSSFAFLLRTNARRKFVVPFFVFLLAASVSATLVWYSERNDLRAQRARLADHASHHAQALQISIERALSTTHTLAALVRQGNGSVANFNDEAIRMLGLYPGVSALELSPGGIVRDAVPLAGNEKAIGYDQLRDPLQGKEARLARDTGQMTLAGPMNLIQGGVGVVGRMPVFLDDASGKPSFWGFTNVVIHFPEALVSTRLTHLSEQNIGYELWRIHPESGQKQIIAASSSHALIEPVDQALEVGSGIWTLSIAPLDGWGNPTQFSMKAGFGLLFSLLLSYLSVRPIRRQGKEGDLENRGFVERTNQLGISEQRWQLPLDSTSAAIYGIEADSDVESALRDREDWPRRQFDDSMVAMLLIDPKDGRIIDANAAARNFYGYSRERLLAMQITEINVLPDAEIKRAIASIVTGQGSRFEFRHRLANGSVREVEVSSSLIRSGERFVLHSIVHDITDRRLAEEALAASEAFKQAILNSVADEIAVVDRQGVIRAVNEPWRRFSREHGSVVGKSDPGTEVGANYFSICQASNGVAAEGASAALAGIQAVLDGRLSIFSQEYPCDGPAQKRWFKMTVIPLGQEGRDGVAITHSDITERKQYQQQLELLVAEQKCMLENDLVGIVRVRNRTITWANPAFERLLGYASGELVGIPTRQNFPSEAAYLAFGAACYPVLATGEVFRSQIEHVRKNGEIIWVDLSGSILDAESNESLWAFLDITSRKVIGQKLQDQKDLLEELVAQRTTQLSAALETAKLADKAKDVFLANVSHELRTPLNAVIGMASLAKGLGAEPKLNDYLSKIVTAGKHLNRIINDLLDLSKIAAGRLEFEKVAFNLRSLVDHSKLLMAHRAAAKRLKFVVTVDPAVPDILMGDPMRVDQILLNLISNAIKFTASGGVEVRLGLLDRQENRVCLGIEVEDSGVGMTPEEIKLLFQPFSQADATVSREYGGTGLGLAISKRLAQAMDGDIDLTSYKGVGTTFKVNLWFGLGNAADLPVADRATENSLPRSYVGVRVLVVDDQPVNREIVEALLASVGIAARLAENGQEAIDILTQADAAAFDLVLMDVQMPVMDGLAATRAIRTRSEFAALPIVGMTAHTMEHEKKISFASGMNDHIGKPFDSATFYGQLAKWIPGAKRDYLRGAEDQPDTSTSLMHDQPAPIFGETASPAIDNKPLEDIVWLDVYSVGVAELDAQHKKLIGMMNRIVDCQSAADAPISNSLDEALNGIFDYLRIHFGAEEEYMRKIGYPGIAAHAEQHAEFLEAMVDFSFSATGSVPDKGVIHRYLRNWLLVHILQSDMEYRRFV